MRDSSAADRLLVRSWIEFGWPHAARLLWFTFGSLGYGIVFVSHTHSLEDMVPVVSGLLAVVATLGLVARGMDPSSRHPVLARESIGWCFLLGTPIMLIAGAHGSPTIALSTRIAALATWAYAIYWALALLYNQTWLEARGDRFQISSSPLPVRWPVVIMANECSEVVVREEFLYTVPIYSVVARSDGGRERVFVSTLMSREKADSVAAWIRARSKLVRPSGTLP